MYRICWNRVILLSCIIGLLVLFLRGCIFAACSKKTEGEAESIPSAAVTVRVHDGGSTTEQPLESYLVGVVAAEMPASFHEQALAAQAVAARTYTLYRIEHGGCNAHDADICTSSACCQAYASTETLRSRWGKAFADNLDRIERAINETAGEVLLYDGKPIDALYHSASGGSTENSEAVFAAAVPYLRAVESIDEVGSSRITGSKTVSREEFCKTVNDAYPNAALEADRLEQQVVIEQTGESGRVRSIRLGTETVSGKTVRKLFSLDSTLFTFTYTADAVRIDTKGFGHGVGMSQTGANAMGKKGSTYEEILLHYYTGVTLGRWL